MSDDTGHDDAQRCPECGELRRLVTAGGGAPRYGCVDEACPAYDPSAGEGDGPDPEKPEIKANQPTGADDVGA